MILHAAMIPPAFLACAMALPATNFTGRSLMEEIEMLRDFIRKHYPDARMVIMPREQRPPIGYERVPLEWRGMVIWIKRKPVTDQRSA